MHFLLYSKPYPTVRTSCREAFPFVGVPQTAKAAPAQIQSQIKSQGSLASFIYHR